MKKLVNSIKKDINCNGQLVIFKVGNDYASSKYVDGKRKDCLEVGINVLVVHENELITEKELIDRINEVNDDDNVDGILVQLPLPKHINEFNVLNAINPEKDVDCLTPYNLGLLMLGKNELAPCTPKGIMRALEPLGDLSGKKAVVVGRSNIVGKPMAMMLLEKNATVTICHSKTKNLEDEVKQADILVVAIGKPKFIKGEWLKENSIVFDVGINRDENNKLCGDVDSTNSKAMYISPVPGGVGLMTRAMVLKNMEDICND